MLLNMTELPIMSWPPEQVEAARKLCKDGIMQDWVLPTITSNDSAIKVKDAAWQTAATIETMNPDAIIIQGEPVFVTTFVNDYCGSQCYSPCYEDGKFVQFRRF